MSTTFDLDSAQLLQREVTRLNPSPIVQLFELDTRPCGDDGTVLYFHNGTTVQQTQVKFQGVIYEALPIEVTGFSLSQDGEPPRPVMRIMNIGGFISAMMNQMDDLVGAKLLRRRTFQKFLDSESTARNVQFPPDEFFIVQKTAENRMIVEFELGTGLDLDGINFPRLKVQSSYCSATYRGEGCRFAGQYAVANPSADLMVGGSEKFRGQWTPNAVYSVGDLTYSDGGVYSCIQQATGIPQRPSNASYWTRVQLSQGEYNSANSYATGDVVFITINGSVHYFLASRAVPVGVSPPNAVYWSADSCAKSLVHCRMRFDPQRVGLVALPFNGFPGTSTIPSIV